MAQANLSDVHRDLKDGMRGADVQKFQIAVNARLKHYGLGHYAVKVDGIVGPRTLEAAWRACYRLGAAWSTCRRARNGRVRESAQRIVRFPGHRLPWQLAKAAWRAKQAKKAGVPVGPSVMYDAVTLSNIPKSAPAVAGYTSGLFPTWGQLAKLFPHARHVSIAVNSGHDAKVLDVEQGDAPPSAAADWIKRQHARGEKFPVIYCSVSVVAEVVRLCTAAGLRHGTDYFVWSAHYTFRAHLCSPKCGFGMPFTAVATQWTDKALGRSLDQSLCSTDFWRHS